MPVEQLNDGSIRISGRFGELFVVQRALTTIDGATIPGPPVGIKLMEAESIEWTTETAVEDVNLPGTGDVGDKDGATTRNGTLTVQRVTPEWQAYHKRTALSGTLADRRRARDRGQRLDRSLVLQVWEDDPSALGAVGWQLVGVRFYRLSGGFSPDVVRTEEHPFRFRDEQEIRGFQRLGGAVDPVTGLPAISYYVGAPAG